MAGTAAAFRSNSRRLLLRHFSTPSNPNKNPNRNPRPKSLTLLRSAINSESDPDRIADLFQSSTHLPFFYYCRPLHAFTVDKLTQLRRPDLIERILHSQISDPKSPKTEGFLTRILSLYSSSGMLDSALQLFDKMPRRTQLSFSALLRALLHHRKYDLVIQKFDQLPKLIGIELGLVPYCLYLKALSEKGDLMTARKVLDEMIESKGLVPDIACYNEVLFGCSKNGNENGFYEILKEISARGVEPNVDTYNCMISMFCWKLQSSRGEELLDVMVSEGLKPNSGSFNTIIDGFCKEGDVVSVVRVFEKKNFVVKGHTVDYWKMKESSLAL